MVAREHDFQSNSIKIFLTPSSSGALVFICREIVDLPKREIPKTVTSALRIELPSSKKNISPTTKSLNYSVIEMKTYFAQQKF